MKKIIYFLLFLSVFMLFSCDGGKTQEKPPKTCEPGFEYKKDWDSCIDIDECKTDNGACEQICTNNAGGFTCSCNDNFVLEADGKTCKDLNDCKENSCNQHGNCIDGDDSFTCECFSAYDVFMTKVSSNLEVVWTKKFTTSEKDQHASITIDNEDNVYLSFETQGLYTGTEKGAGSDAVLIKMDTDANIAWTKQFVTDTVDVPTDIKSNSNGDIYIIGHRRMNKIFIRKLTKAGNELWNKELLLTADYHTKIDLDEESNLYTVLTTPTNISGTTTIGSKDILVMKFNTNGDKLWYKKVGKVSRDSSKNIRYKNNYIYVVGNTDIPQSSRDADGSSYLAKLDTEGNLIFDKTYEAGVFDTNNIDVNQKGEIFIAGTDFESSPNYEQVVKKLNANGEIIWEKEWINKFSEGASIVSMSLNYDDNLIMTGTSIGNVYKVFVTKFSF